jgi:hypothetical protein
MNTWIIERFRRRIVRSEPPPYRTRAGLFGSAITLALLLMLALAGNRLGLSLIWALIIGVPAGLLVALILPIRIKRS